MDNSEKIKKEIEIIEKNFAKKIKNQRSKQKISMVALYKMSGVSSSTISDIEHGHYLPHLEVMFKLGYALKLSREEILSVFNIEKKPKCKKENAEKLIKLLLNDLDFSQEEITEIFEFIKFKARNRIALSEIYK